MYLSEGGYDSVAERFFGRTRVNHFLLEFDTPRAGGFAPLRFVPKDKGVVLGLDRKSTRLNSSHSQISYAVFCLKKKKKTKNKKMITEEYKDNINGKVSVIDSL